MQPRSITYFVNQSRGRQRQDAYDMPATPAGKSWLLYPRKPKNRGNASAGMKVRMLLNRLDKEWTR
jgi:hypothetical protein